MRTTCDCTLRRLLTDEENGRVQQLFRNNGGVRPAGSLLAEIEQFSTREGCQHLHRLDEDTGYCSCKTFIEDWMVELGELAGVKDGRPL